MGNGEAPNAHYAGKQQMTHLSRSLSCRPLEDTELHQTLWRQHSRKMSVTRIPQSQQQKAKKNRALPRRPKLLSATSTQRIKRKSVRKILLVFGRICGRSTRSPIPNGEAPNAHYAGKQQMTHLSRSLS